jgi:hypothetical protein
LCKSFLLLQLVGPRLSLALEATSALRCLLEGSRPAQQEAAAAGATPLLVQVRDGLAQLAHVSPLLGLQLACVLHAQQWQGSSSKVNRSGLAL